MRLAWRAVCIYNTVRKFGQNNSLEIPDVNIRVVAAFINAAILCALSAAFSDAALASSSLPVARIVRPLGSAHIGRAPRIRGADAATRSVVVENTLVGTRVVVFVNGFFAASAPGRAGRTRVRLPGALRPGSQLVAAVSAGGLTRYTLGPTTVQNDYPTYHFDEMRTGWNPYELALTTTNVNPSSFGALFTVSADADVIAQPLYAQNVILPDGSVHNVLYVASEADTLFAYDADTGASLWSTSFVGRPGSHTSAVPATDLGNGKCFQYSQTTVGITSTPVIDRGTNAIYLDTFVKQIHGSSSWHHYLHAVDLGTGLDLPGSPVDITARVTLPSGASFVFNPLNQANRPALLEDNGTLYLAFGSQCDSHPKKSYGWILAYSADTLAQIGVFNSAPDTTFGLASFWQSGFGLAGGDGFVYGITGNGLFTAPSGGYDYGDALLKLGPTLQLVDYFEPHAEIDSDPPDSDFGSGGAVLLPQQTGTYPNLLVASGKDRNVYLVNRDNLGQYTPGGPDNVPQTLSNAVGTSRGVWGGPAYYVSPSGQPFVYYAGSSDVLKAFALLSSPSTQLVLAMQGHDTFRHGGSIPVVSSNGELPGTAVVWAINRPPQTAPETVVLRAYDATNLASELYSGPVGNFDNPYTYFFDVPTVINGKVYASSGTAITAFGLR